MHKIITCMWAATLGCSVGTRGDGRDSFGPPSMDGGDETADGSGEARDTEGPPGGDDESEASTAPPSDESGGEGGPPVARCEQVDLLFVIEAPSHPPFPDEAPPDCYSWDSEAWNEWWEYASEYSNRYSMLQQGFATLVSELYVTVEVNDFNVLVTGSQLPEPQYWGWTQDALGMCVPANVDVDECDQALGAGRNGFTVDPSETADGWYREECMAERYVASGAMDLPETFACLAYDDGFWTDKFYGGYSGEGPDTLMDAATFAVGSVGQAATCNAGFFREDALLVVVFLEVGADAVEDTSVGTPEAWKAALVEAKGGDEDRVVVLSLSPDGDDPHPLCTSGVTSPFATDLRAFTESFEYGLWGSTCLPDYPTFFRAGAEMIDAACGHEPPPAAG